jgi:hypothetical protein
LSHWAPRGAASGTHSPDTASGRRGLVEFTGGVLASSRDWLTDTFASERAHGLLAPWVLHTGLGPEAAGSGYMAQVIAVAVQEGGMPIPRGGGLPNGVQLIGRPFSEAQLFAVGQAYQREVPPEIARPLKG